MIRPKRFSAEPAPTERRFESRIDRLTAAAFTAKRGEGQLPTFNLVAYTGGALDLYGWDLPLVVDLTGIEVNGSRPVLKDHSTSLIVGHTTSVTVQGSELHVAGVISGSGPVAREVAESGIAGFPWRVSIGGVSTVLEEVKAEQQVTVNGRVFNGPIYVARKSVLDEVSFVALAADDDTSGAVAAQLRRSQMQFEAWLKKRGIDASKLTQADLARYKAEFEAESSRAPEPPAADPAQPSAPTGQSQPAQTTPAQPAQPVQAAQNRQPQAPTPEPASPVTDVRLQVAAEMRRIEDVRRIAAGHPEIALQAVTENWTTDQTELAVLRASRPAPAVHTRDNARGNDVIMAALGHSLGHNEETVSRWFSAGARERVMNAAAESQMRDIGLHYLICETIRASGNHAPMGRMNDETIRAALLADQQFMASGFSTISLSGILGNLANKLLLERYQAFPSVVPMIAAETDAVDFKSFTRYRLTGTGIFQKVGPTGELKHGGLTEESYSNQVETFGELLVLTRQDMINDDLGAFAQLPEMLGQKAAIAREQGVFEELDDNSDNFFASGNGNYLTGAGSAFSIAALQAAEQKLLDQVDADGRPIVLQPDRILTGTALKTIVTQMFTADSVNETTSANTPKLNSNPFKGQFKPVISPFINSQSLPNSSSTRWYLLCDPRIAAILSVAYLRGKRVPTIEGGTADFTTLGMYWRGYFDFGVAKNDARAGVMNDGA